MKLNNGADTYNLVTEARHDGYTYRCKVKNATGYVYSDTVTLTVKVKPSIATQPKSVTVNAGETATFQVVAENATEYRWQYLAPGATDWVNVKTNGASATYELTAKARHN